MKGEMKSGNRDVRDNRGVGDNPGAGVYPGAQQHQRGLENKQLVLDFIRSYFASHQYAPTIRETQEALGFGSPSTVLVHLKELEVEGVLKRNGGKPRGIEVVDTTEYIQGG